MMTTIEALKLELDQTPEPLLRELYDVLLRLRARSQAAEVTAGETESSHQFPDFIARQRATFGDQVLPDSQAILDELRADRF